MKKIITVVVTTKDSGKQTWFVSLYGKSAVKDTAGCNLITLFSALANGLNQNIPFGHYGEIFN